MEKIRLGVSSCLMGEAVRYDGQAKRERYITDTLSKWFDFCPVCPEFELGLGVPREPMHLEGDANKPRLVTIRTRTDLTDSMNAWCEQRLQALEDENLSGFIFKSKSPSSGMERVKVYPEGGKGMPVNNGSGLFAAAFMKHFPLVPVEEEGRLHDPVLRDNFIERIFIFQRWRDMLDQDSSRKGLVHFHEVHKYLFMSHGIPNYRQLGKMVADVASRELEEVQYEYQELMMQTLRLTATVKMHVNVLEHLAGYFKKKLESDEKAELHEVIEKYHSGHVPLIVPITLLNHYIRKYNEPYLSNQYYLNPHPSELGLRNHV